MSLSLVLVFVLVAGVVALGVGALVVLVTMLSRRRSSAVLPDSTMAPDVVER